MKAQLKTGEVIELTKDCGCQHHDGPHWLHMDEYWKRKNLELRSKDNGLSDLGFAVEEAARLREKYYEMIKRGIVRLIYE